MSCRIEYTLKAKGDVHRIRNWLFTEDQVLAARFAKGFRASRNRLRELPEIGSEYRARDGTARRRVPVEGFDRYWIYYSFNGVTVRILRVIHTSQNVEQELLR